MIVHAYMGEVVHVMRDGRVRRFVPRGPQHVVQGGRLGEAHEPVPNPVYKKLEGANMGARMMVGLNVGDKPTWTIEQVVDEVYRFRKGGGGSFIAQKGIYRDEVGKRVSEDSVQVVIQNYEKMPREKFVAQMKKLAEHLRIRFQQDEVTLEIQQRGIITDVFGATARKPMAARRKTTKRVGTNRKK